MQLNFIPSSKETEWTVPSPKPAKHYLPIWYKELKNYGNNNTPYFHQGRVVNQTVKSCGPFYDAISHGYIQETWCDIYISENKEYHASRTPQIMTSRNNLSIPISNEYFPQEFAWLIHWMPKTPKGYSVLMTHPFNNLNLPFHCTSGIIDSDMFYHTLPGNYPFYLKSEFSGIIPKGTPMYQIIPIKRENWNSIKDEYDEKKATERKMERFSYFFNPYRRFFQQKKSFK